MRHALRWCTTLLALVRAQEPPCGLATGTGCTEAHEAHFQFVSVPLTDLDGATYGTRTSTVLLVHADGAVTAVERDRDGDDAAWTERAHHFPASAPTRP